MKLIESKNTNSLLSNSEVKRFLEIKDLWKTSMTNKIEDLFNLASDIQERARRSLLVGRLFFFGDRRRPRFLYPQVYPEKSGSELSSEELRKRRKEINDFLKKEKPFLKDNYQSIRRSITSIDKKMLKTESSILEQYPESHILLPSSVSFCPNCYASTVDVRGKADGRPSQTIVTGEIKGKRLCPYCLLEYDRKNARRIGIHEILPSIRSVWNQGRWFEEQVARILRSLGWQTWVGAYVLGTSGILHEVDILGIKKGTILCGECKTGRVKREHTFNFWTKMGDTKSHRGLFASVESLPEAETRRFLTGNPAVVCIEKMKKLSEDDVRKVIQESILGQ